MAYVLLSGYPEYFARIVKILDVFPSVFVFRWESSYGSFLERKSVEWKAMDRGILLDLELSYADGIMALGRKGIYKSTEGVVYFEGSSLEVENAGCVHLSDKGAGRTF